MSFIRAVLFSVFIFVPLLIINAFQTLSILWKPFSLKLFRRYNNFWANYYWSYVGFMAQTFGGLSVDIIGDRLPHHENALVLANHQSAVDIVVQLIVGRTCNRLGDMKFFVKDALKWVPGPGWGMVFLECIFMKRNWSEDRTRVLEQLRRFRKDRVPVWVNIYPEGTRIKPGKLAAAQEFARKNQQPIPHHVLIPRVRGFLATLEGLEGHLHAVYDLTIAYPHRAPTLWNVLSGQGTQVTVEVKRYPIESLPADAEGRSAWLLKLYQDKDKRLETLMAQLKPTPSLAQQRA
ncbi:MAG TPA: lysophospholipid acyltransferase family protein [Oligoflexus sp.]|uniref:lysophospholipid acyltransferase family protein n=1 Tax=Oligoflexus sp. TaxID=1971216 RepID=UPI002D545D68|nr:lysophospholipid acyltransferase family protein [Oligoflexus sp.]HYX33432.1 lysophospholipid acyltransferase family protein [Oligoflexus sp.]